MPARITVRGNHPRKTVEVALADDCRKRCEEIFGHNDPEKLRDLVAELIDRRQIPWTKREDRVLFVCVTPKILEEISGLYRLRPAFNKLIAEIRKKAAMITGAEIGAETSIFESEWMPVASAHNFLRETLADLNQMLSARFEELLVSIENPEQRRARVKKDTSFFAARIMERVPPQCRTFGQRLAVALGAPPMHAIQ